MNFLYISKKSHSSMKFLIVVFIFCLCFLNAQNKRFYYDYAYSNDSTDLDSKRKEILVLDVSSEGSLFYSNKIVQADSIKNEKVKQGQEKAIIYPYKDVLFREIIINKKNQSPKLYYMGGTAKNYYEINLDNEIKWTILPETKTYENYQIQKATAKINSRVWEVWFTKDIPLNTGPYIFQGLPGLVVIAEDKIKSHSFKLIGISNIDTVNLSTIPMFHSKEYSSYNTKIALNTKEFRKLLINNEYEYLNDIVPSNPNNIGNIVSSKFYDKSGNEISQADYVRAQRESRKAIVKKNNNKLINDFKR